MGLIGWIKKEIESTSRQRRQSAPPPLAHSLASPNQLRDEAYMRAISKFNEWRDNQRFEKLNESKNHSALTQITNEHSIMTNDVSISDVEIDDNEKRKLIEIHRRRKVEDANRKLEHEATIYGTAMTRNHRLSLPIMKKENVTEQPTRRRNRKSRIHPSTTIDEIEEFEQNHCGNFEENYSIDVTSPPKQFYRNNSEPYVKNPTPKKSLMGRGMLRQARSHSKGKAPQPPIIESESSSGFRSGNFRHFGVTSPSVYSEFLSNYKACARKQSPEKINSVGESASSGSLSSDPDKIAKSQRRLSPPYQRVINKHGDEVEYALPYNELDSDVNIPALPTSQPPQLTPSKFDQIINENFEFLHSNLEYFNAEADSMLNEQINAAFEPIIDASFSDLRRRDAQVTDLDRSIDNGLVTPGESGDIFRELDALSKWANNLEKCEEEKSPLQEYQSIEKSVKVFRSKDIKYKPGSLRNSFSTPLEFSTGYFNSTPVTLRSTLPNIYGINSFADVANKREFEILTQTKHQSIAILMGISHDSDLRVMSLILEPFDFTLNHYLHQMDQYFSIQETIAIVQQIAGATQYLHENGFVHSNISSHAVLIRESPFAAKLSSFELTTEILPREAIGKIYQPRDVEDEKNLMMNVPADLAIAEKYYKLSKQHFFNRTTLPVKKEQEEESEYRLPYSVVFRRMFSMHFYQPPELLITSKDEIITHVLPTTRSDTFGLALLLWESLNHCVPFVTFNHDELVAAYVRNEAKLPLLDKTCGAFMEIFDSCLRVNADERISDASEFISILDVLRIAGDGKKATKTPEKSFKNLKNAKISEKMPVKNYFKASEADPQQRLENMLTRENLMKLRESSKISDTVKSSEIEANLASFTTGPGILQDDAGALDRIRKSVEDQRIIAPKKPTRKHDEVFNFSKRSLTDSTMCQSFFEFNRLQTPKIDKNGIYERTSTLKKRLKPPKDQSVKKSVKELFEKPMNVEKMNNELDQIPQMNFMDEIVQELRDDAASFLNTAKIHDQSHSSEELQKTPEKPTIQRSESDYRFEIDDYSLPRTPIARQNKIRRNAWLSDSKKPSGGRISNAGVKPNKSGGDLVVNNSPASQKHFNVSIKIHKNVLEKSPKVNNVDLNGSKYGTDINKKYYPMMPEMLSDVIQNKRDRSMVSQSEDFNRSLWLKDLCQDPPEVVENVIIPVRLGVKETVKMIESTYKNPAGENVSPKVRKSIVRQHAHEETQTEDFQAEPDEVNNCLMQASESIQKLNEMFQLKEVPNKRVETLTSLQTPTKITTKVTVNLKQISRRSSDVSHLKQMQELNRHSICNNTELIKKLQMHFRSKKNDSISASCSSLVTKSTEIVPPKCSKFFCRNCGFTMLPAEVMQKIQSTGRLSIASSLAEGLHSIEGSQSMASIRRCLPISEAKSTEDIYIDDDFCQGIQTLAANMELLPPPDLFDSFDLNLWTAEILHREERDCDWALTHHDQMPMEWREEGNHDQLGEISAGNMIEGKTEDRKADELGSENKSNEPKTADN